MRVRVPGVLDSFNLSAADAEALIMNALGVAQNNYLTSLLAIARGDVAAAVQASAEFTGACPDSALAMRAVLT